MIGAVIFDVDGTLVDSNDLHARAWRETFRHFGIELPLELVRAQVGKGGDNLIPALLPPQFVEVHQQELEDFRSALFRRDYIGKVHPFPGVIRLFERLRGDDVRIVLATSSNQRDLDHHVALLGCRDLIDATACRDDVAHSKPCPDLFRAALAKVAPLCAGEVLVLGDSPYDIAAAREAGIEAIGVRCGGFTDALLIQSGATLVFDDPVDLLDNYVRIFSGAARTAERQLVLEVQA
jgi:HAD superfamily hydrolase (TIGR01509 family)